MFDRHETWVDAGINLMADFSYRFNCFQETSSAGFTQKTPTSLQVFVHTFPYHICLDYPKKTVKCVTFSQK